LVEKFDFTQKDSTKKQRGQKNIMLKNIFVFLIGILSLVYLINPGMGIFELIPDNLPIIGNLDEAGAAVLLIAALKYFGVDLTRFFIKDRINN
jgi:uncharacterized membrane protein YkvA (DUF1232 family)